MAKIQSINPFTKEINGVFETLNYSEIDEKIELGQKAFLHWKNISKKEKKELFLNLSNIIDAQKEELARLEMSEMGMIYNYSLAGISKTSHLVRWFAENFEKILQDEEYESEGLKIKSQYDPLGMIFGIAPWNFPFNQVLRAAVPNILAGNTVVYKHASSTPLCGIKIEELFKKAGFPMGVYQNILISSRDCEYIIAKKEIRGVNLTGSEGAGKSIGALAGKYLKPSVLELGGNDAFIVGETSHLKQIAIDGVKARVSNNGQKCNSSKRFIVQEKYYSDFCKYFTEYTNQLVIGDPMEPKTEIGPMSKEEILLEIDDQVKKTIKEGAKLLTGGKILDMNTCLYSPTVLADVTPEMTSFKEEVFGPIASIIKVKDLKEALKLANDSEFGLSACVYGDDYNELLDIAEQLEGGMIFINLPAGSKASLPFGGVKNSGYGKENGPEGLKSFTNKKIIVSSK